MKPRGLSRASPTLRDSSLTDITATGLRRASLT